MLLLFWKQILISIILAGISYTGINYVYQYGYQYGYTSAETKYTKIIKEYQVDVANKIAVLERTSTELATKQQKNSDKLTKDIGSIMYSIKDKSLVIVKEGKCTPSKTFLDSFIMINKQVNQNIKDSQK